MIPSTFVPINFKTVPPTYSWDQGTPGINYDPLGYITSLSANEVKSIENEEGVEYVGYAPFVYISLSSFPGQIREDHLALERTVDFGDYYNSESNKITAPGLSSEKFCHIYVMPGLYSITYTRTEHTFYEYIDTQKCLQKHCISWSFDSLEAYCYANRGNPVTWESTSTGGVYQKKWEFERCDATEYMTAGLYVQPTDKAVKHPLSWQWFHFLQNPLDRRNDPITWLSAGFQQEKQFTWNDSNGPCVTLPIEGITWRWDKLVNPPTEATLAQKLLIKPITWDELATSSPLNTTWDFAKNNCSTVGTIVLSANTQQITKKAIVRVKEIPPTAYLTIEQPEDRLSPLTVRLSPKDTICGSFPIEKIVWDLGDGTPLIEQRRWSNTLEKPFVFSGALGNDYEDPRNYDIIHTYIRSANSPSTFYPSMTAYAANTYTSDSASVMVGPLKYKNTDGSNFRLLQSELTDSGKALIGQIDDTNLGFWKIETTFKASTTIQQTYYYFGYYSADKPLIYGKSVLYTGIYNNSPKATSLSGLYALTVDMAGDGSAPDKDFWQTDENGVITWSKYLAHPVPLQNFVDLDLDPSLPTNSPYIESYGFYVDTPVLINGVSILYDSTGSSADFVVGEFYDNLDIDDDGRIDTFTTNASGVISWTPKIYYQQFYPGLSGYTNTQFISSGITKLYNGPYSNASIVRLEQGTAYLKPGENNLYDWSTDGYGVITYSLRVSHPYPVGQPVIGYVDVANLQQDNLVLWNGPGTGATPVTFVDRLTSEIFLDGDVYFWSTNASGILNWQIYTKYFIFGDTNYYVSLIPNPVDTDFLILSSGVSQLWNGVGTAATKVLNLTGQTILNDAEFSNSFGLFRTYYWQTNNDGILTLSAVKAHPYYLNLDPLSSFPYKFYTDDAIPVSKNAEQGINGSLIWDDYGTEASLVTNAEGSGDVNGDGNFENWSTDEFGQITFAIISAHPFKQFYGYSDHEILSSGISILWSNQYTGATILPLSAGVADVDKNGSLDSWYINNVGIIRWTEFNSHPWEQFYGFTDNAELVNGTTVLWSRKGSGATLLTGVSGIFDVDTDGNFDTWKTNENGVLSWVTLTAHPYKQFQLGGVYYTDNANLTSGKSVLWNDYKSSADFVERATGTYDFEGDGDNDIWYTDIAGRIFWRPIALHPFKFANTNYFTDTFKLTSGISKIWNKSGTGATVVSLQEGVADINGDGNLDQWVTLDDGVIEWDTIEYYPYNFLDTAYFIEENFLLNGITTVWSNKYSSATKVVNVTGEAFDLGNEGDEVIDTWIINSDGILSWTKRIDYPFQFPGLSGFTNTQYITSGVTILKDTKFVDASPVINLSGLYLNRDNDLSEWKTNSTGVITWTLLSAHPYKQLGSYFTDNPLLTSGTSILWSKPGTGAIPVTGVAGTALIDSNLDLDSWSTDFRGVLTWVTLSVYPFKQFYGYSDTLKVVSGVTRLKLKPTSTTLAVAVSSGLNDVDGDGNLDTWSTNGIGTITYALSVIHPYKLPYGQYYTDTQQLVRNQTLIWNGPGTGAKVLSGIILENQSRSSMVDLDGDGNVDYIITNPNGTYNWSMFLQYPRSVLDGSYFTDEVQLRSGLSRVYLGQGSGSTFAVSISNTIYTSPTEPYILTLEDGTVIVYNSDIQGAGNLATWSIDANGIITFDELRIYPYETIPGYFTKQAILTSGISELYNGFGTGASRAVNLTGIDLVDEDTKSDIWKTNSNGIVTWVTLTSQPYSQFQGFTKTPTIEKGITVLYQTKFSDSEIIDYGTGVYDIDQDGNLDTYTITNEGTVLWNTLTAHPYLQFPGYLSAADTQILTTPISVAGHPTIPGTNVTYYSITSFDTYIGGDGLERPLFVSKSGHFPVPSRPFDQTFTILTAADVVPLVVNGVTQTTPVSVAGNPNIPGTIYTYRMVPRNDGYTDLEIPNNGDVLFQSFGSGALPLIGASGYSLVGPNSAYWHTNSTGNLTIDYVSAHPYFQFAIKTDETNKKLITNVYTDTPNIISGVSVIWSDYRTAASRIAEGRGIDDIDGDGTEEEWYSDGNGIIHFTLTITIGTYFYSINNRDWYDTKNWYIYPDKNSGANRLPTSATNVVILSTTLPPLVNLDDIRWVQPNSIDASKGGLEFYSNNSVAVTCALSGSDATPIRFTGKSSLATKTGTFNGRFWSSKSETNWYVLSNWYYDKNLTLQANALPLSTGNVTILSGSVIPYVNLDNPLWKQPKSIDTFYVGITFYSEQKGYVDCKILSGSPITAPVTFAGDARYGKAPLPGVYWYSTTSTDWYNINNWYVDSQRTLQADVLPLSTTHVIALPGSVAPIVNVDFTQWISPSSIDVTSIEGITLSSDNPAGVRVTSDIYGTATFIGFAYFNGQQP